MNLGSRFVAMLELVCVLEGYFRRLSRKDLGRTRDTP